MASQEAQQIAPPVVQVEFKPPGVAIVTLRGEHDLSTRQRLTEALAAASARPNVLVNLSECTFIDSSIVHALLMAGTSLRARDGRLELVIPPKARVVRRVAELTPLASTLPIHETRSAAVAGLRTGQHSIQLKDSRDHFGDQDTYTAKCSCGWSSEPRIGWTARRMARRDGVEHTDGGALTPRATPSAAHRMQHAANGSHQG
jgi:anti-anti-sigma factor